MDIETPAYKNFRLVHELKRRIRIITPTIKNDRERGYILEILLKKRPEIRRIRTIFRIGSVVIEFDPVKLPKKNLLILLDAVLGNIAQKSPSRFNQQIRNKCGKLINNGKETELLTLRNEVLLDLLL